MDFFCKGTVSRCQYSVSEHSRFSPIGSGGGGLSYSIHVIIHFRSDHYILDRNQIYVAVSIYICQGVCIMLLVNKLKVTPCDTVTDMKSVQALRMKLVAPMPEQIPQHSS